MASETLSWMLSSVNIYPGDVDQLNQQHALLGYMARERWHGAGGYPTNVCMVPPRSHVKQDDSLLIKDWRNDCNIRQMCATIVWRIQYVDVTRAHRACVGSNDSFDGTARARIAKNLPP